MKKLYLHTLVFLFLITLLSPSYTEAADIRYGRVVDISSTQVLIDYSGIAHNKKYICTLTPLTCNEAAADTVSLKPTKLFKANDIVVYNQTGDQAVVTTVGGGTGLTTFTTSLYTIVNGAATLTSSIPLATPVDRAVWTHDGTKILIFSQGTIYLYNKTTITITSTYSASGVSTLWLTVSPDGRYVAYYIPATQGKPERVFTVIDLVNKEEFQKKGAVPYWDLLSEGIKIFTFSPDSTKLVYMDDRNGPQTPYLVDLKKLPTLGLTGTRVIGKSYTVSDVMFKSNDTILFSGNREDPLTWSLYAHNLTTSALTKIDSGISYASAFKKSGNTMIYTRASANGNDPMMYDLTTGITSAFPIIPDYSGVPKTGTDSVIAVAGMSGALMKPDLALQANSPLLVWLHGGPFRQTSLGYHSYASYGGYDLILEALRNKGVTVLKLDYPGSYGYGRPFAESIQYNVGKKDVQSLASAVTSLKKTLGNKDTYLIGNSYGAYLSLRAVVENPTLYKGAFSINGVTDWGTLMNNIPDSIFGVHFKGPPGALNSTLYAQAGIANRIQNITNQKIVLAHGDNDMTIPFAQSELLFGQLGVANKKADLVAFADEDHVYKKAESFETLCLKMFEYVDIAAGDSCEIK